MYLTACVVTATFVAVVLAQPHEALQPAAIIVLRRALYTILNVVRVPLALHRELVALTLDSLLLELDDILAVLWVAALFANVIGRSVWPPGKVRLLLGIG